MLSLIKVEVTGKRNYDFEADGRKLSGTTYYGTYENEDIDGLAAGKFNVSGKDVVYQIGDMVTCVIVKGNLQLVR